VRASATIAVAGLILAALAGGCARSPSRGTSGVRLVVTLRFAGPINDNYQYFFLIRNGNDPVGENGPIPVIQPPYLNGFATGLNNQTAAFTDFVEYSRVQRQVTASGYTLYHLPGGISGDPNRDVFEARGEPDAAQPPAGGNILHFELDLGRLQPDSGDPDPNNGQQPRYLQVNVVATTTTPHNPTSVDPNKFLDAFGDQRPGSGSFNTYITIDAAQIGRTWSSSTNPGDPTYEPDNDEYPSSGDPAVELTGWSIQVTRF